MGADVIGVELEILRWLQFTEGELKPGEAHQGDPQFLFVPWQQVKMLLRS